MCSFHIKHTGASRNREALEKHGITHIINWSSSAKCSLFDDKFIYLCISGVRGNKGMTAHLEDLDKAVDLIDEVRREGGKVLRSVRLYILLCALISCALILMIIISSRNNTLSYK